MKNGEYIPALKYSWLTRFYDPVVAVTTREKTFRRAMLESADITNSSRVLDLACGTGTFALMVKSAHPNASVRGLDGDPQVLRLARAKAVSAGLEVVFDEGLSFAMPYPDESFDTIFSSLFFHHLTTENKLRSLEEVFRVLRPGGVLHVCDWGQPSNRFSRIRFTAVRLLDGFDVTRDNVEGRLPFHIGQAGFSGLETIARIETPLGTLDLMTVAKPE